VIAIARPELPQILVEAEVADKHRRDRRRPDLVDLNAIHVGRSPMAYAADVTEDGSLVPLRISIYDEGAPGHRRRTDATPVRADEPCRGRLR
jgi:hypothetical protein